MNELIRCQSSEGGKGHLRVERVILSCQLLSA